jgi:hypothetical protein
MTAPVPILSIQFKASRHGPGGKPSASPRQVSLRAEQNTDMNIFGTESHHIVLYAGVKINKYD